MSDATMRITGTRRRAVAAVMTVLGAVGLTACASGGEEEGAAAPDKTEIRFTYATGDESWNSAVKSVVEAYNAQSEIATVQLDPLTGGTDYATAVKTMDATGNWPAVIDMRDTRTYIEAGKLAPIPEEVTALIDDEAYAAAADGNVYAVPSSALNGEVGLNIIYDKAYFAENDLAVPATYDEFIELLEAIKANGDVPLATAAGEIWPSDQLWKPLASSVFAEWADKGGFWAAVEEGKASVEDLREPLDRLKYITDNFVLEGWQSTQDAQTTTLLVNHQAVMATSSAGIGRLNDIHKVAPDFEAGLFIVPDDEGNINVLKNSVNGDTLSGLSISAQAKENGAEYDAAVDFLTFFYSVEAADIIEQSGVIAPNLKLADEITRNTAIPGAEDYFALLESPKLVWYQNETLSPNFSAFNTFFRQTRIEMQDGQTTIDEAIAKSQTEFDNTISAG